MNLYGLSCFKAGCRRFGGSVKYNSPYYYAKNILNNRFPAAEPVIAQSSNWALPYSKDVIKGRFFAYEEELLSNHIRTDIENYLNLLKSLTQES